jgi:hypothetical protein
MMAEANPSGSRTRKSHHQRWRAPGIMRSRVAIPTAVTVRRVTSRICRWGMLKSYRSPLEGAIIHRANYGPIIFPEYTTMSHL